MTRTEPREPSTSSRGFRADLVAVGSAALLVAVAAVVGDWLLQEGVPLHVDAPPVGAQWLPHLGPGTIPAVLVAMLVILRGPELAARLRWRLLLGISAVAALAWTMSLALVDGWQRGVADRLTTDTEYLHDVPRVSDVGAMLRIFAERIPGLQPESWTTHVAGHPPGALLVFVGLDRIGLSGGVPAALLCVLVGSTAGVAVAVTLQALGAEAAGRAALPFGVLFPGAVWIGVSADGLFAGVLAWGVALLALGAARPRLDAPAVAACVAGGLVLGVSLYLSYGLVLAGLLPLAVAIITRRVAPLLVAGAGVVAVVVAFAAAGFWWFDGYQQVVIRYYQPGEYGLERPYSYWVWANVACLAVVLGPAGVAGLRRVFTPGRGQPHVLVALCAAAALAVLAADLSGLSKAEVERIWLPFAVWLVAAAALLPARQTRWWLALRRWSRWRSTTCCSRRGDWFLTRTLDVMHPFRRAGRRTNLALLVLLILTLASGVAAFAVGSPGPARIVVVTHGVAGLAVVALAPWKSVVVRRGWRQRRPGRGAGLALAVLVVIVLGSGLLHTLGGFRQVLGLTPMQVHVGGAVIVLAVLLAHLKVHPTRPRRTDASRRTALGGLTLAASAGAAYALLESAGGLLRWPAATRRQTGSHQLGTDAPAAMPITQWFTDTVPSIDASTWRVRLSAGGVSRELSPDKLAGADTVRAVLDCTNGWYSEQTWRGTRLDRLLPPGAGGSVLVTSVTGYRRRLPAADAPGLLLATHVAGAPLSAGHGAPVRLVAPGRRGFWWVKWVTAVELSDEPWWLQSPFPLQ